jgi:hypothetical protein
MTDQTEEPQPRHTGGKPEVEIDPAELEKIARLNCTVAEAASFFGCHKRTLQRYLAEQPKFKEAWDRGRRAGRLSLRRLQWRHASGTGASAVQMAIHLSKHWLGESERVLNEISGKDGGPIEIMNVRARVREKLKLAKSAGTGTDSREPE